LELTYLDLPGPRRDFVGYGRERPKVTWPGGATVAVNLVVNYEEGSEYSLVFGDDHGETVGEIGGADRTGERDLYVESVFEYGSRAGVWRLLRVFDEYEVKVTFYACAVAVERNPDVGAWIRKSGHEPCSHGWRFSEHWTLSEEEERERITWAVESIARTCGRRPLGWYSRFAPSVNTRRLLVEEGGFLYDSDAYNDDLPYFTTVGDKPHLVVPYNTLPYNDARFIAAGGYSAGSDFVEMCKRGIDELRREGQRGYGAMMSIGLHPRLMGQAARSSALREVIEYGLELGDVWFARREDVARFWLENFSAS
jgi:peptidoglycan/xylan/chitin deacetylase (PgdA/CDA1 family)